MNDKLPAVRIETSHELANPTTDSWTIALAPVVELARNICTTDFVPDGMRNNVAATTAAIMYGRELGLAPMTALGATHLIKGRVGVSAEMLRALVLEQGHEIVVRESSGAQVVMAGRRKGTSDWTVVTWTLDDARRAKLSGDNWTKYPRQMLAARASAELCRLIFADVIHGMAATEELEGIDAPALGGPGPALADGRTKVQRKTRTAKTDDGAATSEPLPPSGSDQSAAPSSPPLPPLPGEPGFDEPSAAATAESDAEAARAAQSADAESRVPAASASSPQIDDGAATPPAVPTATPAPTGGEPAAESATSKAAPSSLPGEEDLPEPVEDITDPQRGKLFALMTEHGLKDRDQQLVWISKNLRRELTSRSQLTKDDAIVLIDLLETLDQTARPVSRGDLRLLAGLFKELEISDSQERLHIASSIIGRTPMKGDVSSAEGLTSREANTLLQALGRCKNRDQVEALVQMAEEQRAEAGDS